MKVLFIDQYGRIGGGQTVLIDMIGIALSKNIEVSVLAPAGGALQEKISKKYSDKADFKNLAVPSMSAGKKGIMDILKMLIFTISFLRFLPFIKKFDVVYVNGGRVFPPVALLSIFTSKIRFIYHIHINIGGLEKKLLAWISGLKNTYAIIANSDFIKREISKNETLAKSPVVRVIENALSEALSHTGFKNPFDKTEPFNVVLIGQLTPDKGQEIVLNLAKSFPDIRFHVVGQATPEDKHFEEHLKSKASENISFYGWQNNLSGFLHNLPAHLSLMTTKLEESFGLVAIESMVSSCITISTEFGALPDITAKTGMITYKTEEELENHIKELSSKSPDELEKIALEQHKKTIKTYGFERFKKEISDIL